MNAPHGINTHTEQSEDIDQGLPKLRPTPDTVQGISWQLGPGSMPCLVISGKSTHRQGTQVSLPKLLLLGSCSIFLPKQLQAAEGYARPWQTTYPDSCPQTLQRSWENPIA